MGTVRNRFAALMLFSAPMIVCQAIELSWRLYMPAFLALTAALPLGAVAGLMFWVRLFDAAADPLVGLASDRVTIRWGRRKPWIVAAIPLICGGAAVLHFAGPGDPLRTIAGAAVLLHLGYALLVVPHGGWGLELAATGAGQTRVMGAKMWAFLAGVPLTLGLAAVLERTAGATLAQQVAGIGWMLIVLTPPVLLALVGLLAEPPARPCPDPAGAGAQPRAMLARPAMLRIVLLYAVLGLADAAEGAVTLFFIGQALHLAGWGSTALLVPVLAGLLALPLWTACAARIGQRRTLAAVLALRIVTAPLALLLPAGEIAPLVALLCLRGSGLGADYMLLRAMTAGLVGGRRLSGGAGHAATHYALFTTTAKLAAAIGAAAALWALDRAGFVPGAGAMERAGMALRLLYALPSCIAGLVGLAVLATARTGQRRSLLVG